MAVEGALFTKRGHARPPGHKWTGLFQRKRLNPLDTIRELQGQIVAAPFMGLR
ncbi:MAG TPA: hypothetical protein VH186_01275 [Chloroflexia bacterium]|nr:hypothetical protein [Chloroflexia bacterium]